jgi:hypothetical protein
MKGPRSMSAPEFNPKVALSEEINEARLEEWRKSRAELAAKSKAERLRRAEEDKAERLRKFEDEKAQRVRDAARKRAQEEAAVKAERRARAQTQLPSRVEIDAAAQRIEQRRAKERRAFLGYFLAFVIAPTAAIGLYLFTLATPLFEARTKLMMLREGISQPRPDAGLFGSIQSQNGAGEMVRDIVLSPAMLEALNTQADFTSALSKPEIDVFTRFAPSSLMQETQQSEFERFVTLTLDASNETGELRIKGPDAQAIARYSEIVLQNLNTRVAEISQSLPESQRIQVTQTTPTYTSNIAVYPRRIESLLTALAIFAAAFAIGRITVGAAKTHARI